MNPFSCRLLAKLLLVALLAGCSGKTEEQVKKSDSGKIVDREEKPLPKKDGSPKKESDPKPNDSKPPDTGIIGNITGKKIGEEFRDDVEKVKQRYHGRIMEVTAVVEEIGLNATGGAFLMVAGQEIPVARQIEFVMNEPEPWGKVIPGQTATLKARCEVLGEELRFKEATILDAKGPGRLTVTAIELASKFEKNPKEAGELYGDHYVDVSGTSANIERAADKDLVRLTFKTPGKVLVSCEFTGEAIGPLRGSRTGSNVKVFGKVNSYNAAQGVELKGCLLYSKP